MLIEYRVTLAKTLLLSQMFHGKQLLLTLQSLQPKMSARQFALPERLQAQRLPLAVQLKRRKQLVIKESSHLSMKPEPLKLELPLPTVMPFMQRS